MIIQCLGLRLSSKGKLLMEYLRCEGSSKGEIIFHVEGKYKDTAHLLKCYEAEETESNLRIIRQLPDSEACKYTVSAAEQITARASQAEALAEYKKINRKKAPVLISDQQMQALSPFREAYQKAKNPGRAPCNLKLPRRPIGKEKLNWSNKIPETSKEFEQLPEIAEMLAQNEELKWNPEQGRYCNNRVFQDAECGYINGALYGYQEALKKNKKE